MSAPKEFYHQKIELGMTSITVKKQSIHLIHLVHNKRENPQLITTRCGTTQTSEKIKTTYDQNEVTCRKCLRYVNNPYQVLRKYGKVKVLKSFFVVLLAGHGYEFDMVACADTPGKWIIIAGRKGEPYLIRNITVFSMADLGFKLLAIIEKEFKNSPILYLKIWTNTHETILGNRRK